MRWLAVLVLGTWAAAAQAADAPKWPERAVLLVGTSQKLYDEPAKDEAELTRRLGLYRLDLRWPAAPGAVRYRVRRDGVDVATVTTTEWGADVKGAATYAVEAGDAAGRWSAPLSAQVSHDDGLGSDAAVIGVLGGPREGGAFASVFGDADVGEGFVGLGTVSGDRPAGGIGLRPPPVRGGEGAGTLGTRRLSARLGEPTVSGGLDAASVTRTMTSRAMALAYCVERAKAAAGTKATLKLTVAADGTVSGAEATVEPANAAAGECLQKLALRFRLPAAEKATSVVAPITFEKR